jgi:hypothetical protein
MVSSLAVLRSRAFDGESGGKVEAWQAASTTMTLKRRKGVDLLTAVYTSRDLCK